MGGMGLSQLGVPMKTTFGAGLPVADMIWSRSHGLSALGPAPQAKILRRGWEDCWEPASVE